MPFSSNTKISTIVKQQSKCATCGEHIKLRDNGGLIVNYDHIHPKALGGSDDASNCQALCPNCHDDKTHGNVDQIAKKQTMRAVVEDVRQLKETVASIQKRLDLMGVPPSESMLIEEPEAEAEPEEAEEAEPEAKSGDEEAEDEPMVQYLSVTDKLLKSAYAQSRGTRDTFELNIPNGIVPPANNGSSLRNCFRTAKDAGSYPLHLEKVTEDGEQLPSSSRTKFVRFTVNGLKYAKNL